MVTEGPGLPLAASDKKTLPAIQHVAPIINDTKCAIDDLGCSIERLSALFKSNNADLTEIIISPGLPSDGWLYRQLNEIVMIYDLAIEKLDEVQRTTDAITNMVIADNHGAQS